MVTKRKKKAQATVELTLVVGSLLLLLLGIVRVMNWFNGDMVRRQDAFLNSRVAAGAGEPGTPIDYTTEDLSVFGE